MNRGKAMNTFISEDFLLQTQTARVLYHQFAEEMPIFDFHCHLPVREIAENKNFDNLTQIWLKGDHYKWRAMRAAGIDENLITGSADDFAKFKAWAPTVPKTLRNPLYQWTHLELKRYFGIAGKLLGPQTAGEIYCRCSEMLSSAEFSPRRILERMNVKVVSTTDAPVDPLEYHHLLKKDRTFPVKILPAFRADNALSIDRPAAFRTWIERLEAASGIQIGDYGAFIEAIRKRHDAFHEAGCRLSDHGIEQPYAEKFTEKDVKKTFDSARQGKKPAPRDLLKYQY